ncbi:S8 family peptidase [Brevibacillus fulvus]|uniref:Major intracellular serine protease n=1 Tax=Brevibacillus fulvus TaxID=1125967 RepID=A0A939BUC2_9BACL|nr:S8 family peptidase [Brevibacillus fulvus]MBM7590329.1 major intracellular serine protease [Brevibacillus fulvus]
MVYSLVNHTVLRGSAVPNQGVTDYIPTGIQMMGTPYLWTDNEGEGSVIAILDTGIDRNHPDLRSNIIDGRNFTTDYNSDPANYEDNHYHGTHVAGIIAAVANQSGIVGVAPRAKLFIGKVLTGQGYGEDEWITNAIEYCIDWTGPNGEKISVINMSLGGPDYNPNLHAAIQRATENNIAVIVAAGNEGDGSSATEEISYPAYLPEVIAVGAVDYAQKVAYFSNTNRQIDVAAPGVNILSCYPRGTYAILSGTSMASPHVAGFAALLRGKFFERFGRYPSEPELYTLIKYHTVDIAEIGMDTAAGAGFVSALPYLQAAPSA